VRKKQLKIRSIRKEWNEEDVEAPRFGGYIRQREERFTCFIRFPSGDIVTEGCQRRICRAGEKKIQTEDAE